jgi:excisionase family DNA binding protein
VRNSASRAGEATEQPRFYSVKDTARMLGVSEMSIYRAIADGRFPAMRFGKRLIIPAQAFDEMIAAATTNQTVVDVAEWTADASTKVRPRGGVA